MGVDPMIWIAIVALVVGILLLRGGKGMRERRGLGHGRTTGLDNRTLYSSRFGLAGRPDRIIDGVIPEEWKSGSRVYDSHRAQLGCYFILIEEETGVRPTHWFISLGDGQRIRIENTPELRARVLDIADQIRQLGCRFRNRSRSDSRRRSAGRAACGRGAGSGAHRKD